MELMYENFNSHAKASVLIENDCECTEKVKNDNIANKEFLEPLLHNELDTVYENDSKKTNLITTPITTNGTCSQNIRSKKKKPNTTNSQLSQSLSLSLEKSGYLYNFNKNKNNQRHSNNNNSKQKLCSSDEIDSSASSASMSASTTPPNELQSYSLNYSSFIPYTRAEPCSVHSPSLLDNKPNLIKFNYTERKTSHSDSVRSLSDIFGRRFETGKKI